MFEAIALDRKHYQDLINITINVNGIGRIKTKEDEFIICARQGSEIIGYRFEKKSDKWVLIWREKVFDITDDPLKNFQPWLVTDNFIVVKNSAGINFYQQNSDRSKLNFLSRDGSFHDLHFSADDDSILMMGRFYTDVKLLGALTRINGTSKFFVVSSEDVENGQPYPMWPMYKKINLASIWTSAFVKIFSADLQRNGQDLFVLNLNNTTEIYKFNDNYDMDLVIRSQMADGTKRLFFANLTNQSYQEVIQLTDVGLYTYQYDKASNSYLMINYDGDFSENNGWKDEYSNSIQILDLNADDRDDLIFTGQSGITALYFDDNVDSWMSLFNPEFRNYATIAGAISRMPHTNHSPFIFMSDIDGVYWSRIVQESQRSPQPIQSNSTAIVPPIYSQIKPTILPKTYARNLRSNISTLRWIDQWDDNFLKNSVSIGSGKVNFKLPLIDTSNVDQSGLGLFLIYDSNYGETKLAGKGWMAITGEEYIGVHRPTSYEKDNVYYIISSGFHESLKIAKSTENELHFEKSKSNDKIVYELKNERWIIETDDDRSIYGRCNDREVIRWGWRWKYWQGPTRDTDKLQKCAFAWYLCQKHNKKSSQIANYEYENDIGTLPSGKAYTKANRLVRISNQSTKLTIEYGNKNDGEYDDNSPMKDEIIQFPIQPSNSHYIKKCSVETFLYKQSFQFKYAAGKSRLLTEIQQVHSDKYESLLKFEYQESLMTKAVSPFGLTAEFTYELGLSNPKKYAEIKSYPASEDLKFIQGSDYAVIAYPQSNRLIVQFYDGEMLKTSEISTEFTGKLEFYHIQPYERSLVVLLEAEKKELLHFNRRNDTWNMQPKRSTFNNNVKIKMGNKFVAVTDLHNKIVTLFNIEDWNSTIVRNEPSDFVAESKHFIAAYDDVNLKIFWLDQGTLKTRNLKYLPRLASDGQSILKRFDLDDDWSKKLLLTHQQHLLQATDNAIMLSALQENGGTLYLNVYIFLVDAANNLVFEDFIEIKKEKITDLQETFQHEGTTFKLNYITDKGYYKVRYSEITGTVRDEIDKNHRNKNRRQDAHDNLLKVYNENDESLKAFKFKFLLEWDTYLIRLNPEGIRHGDKMLYIGDKIERSTSSQKEFKLGSRFIVRNNETTYTFFNTENRELLEIDSSSSLVNQYPDYIAYQKNQTLTVLPFKENSFDSAIYWDEKLLSADADNLYTIDGKFLKIRPVSTFIQRKSESVKTFTLTDGRQRRFNTFKRTSSTNKRNQTCTESIRIIPATDCGWYEIVSEYPLKGNVTHTRSVFDKDGTFIMREEEPNDPPKNSDPGSPGMLWDESGEWLISNFHPYSLAEQDAAYYGFESYEINRIGSSKKWTYNPKNVVNGGFSLTGRNHLRLSSKDSFEGIVQPRNQFDTYVASCWLRTDSLLPINEATNLLKATITVNGKEIITLIGHAKRQFGFWFYIEIILDFKTIRSIHENYVDYTNEVNDSNFQFEIKLIVSNDSQPFVDLDHIRFSPIVHEFQATSYSTSGKPTSTLQNDGTISHIIYDYMDRQIAEIRNDGEIGELTTISKSGRLPFTKSITDQPCILKFEPENGVYERFDESTWSDSWKIDDVSAWKISLGQLWHQNTNPHRITASATVFDESSALLRFNYLLESSDAILKMSWSDEILSIARNGDFSSLTYKDTFDYLPLSGELIIMIEQSRLFVWLDAVLLIDRLGAKPWSGFGIEAKGRVSIEDFITANRPRLDVQYLNAWMEKSQMIQLENEKTVLVNEILYDEIGRPGITTKKTRVSSDGAILAYRESFANPEYVWNNGRLKGEVDDLNPDDEGYAYSRKEYEPNPLDRKTAEGLPGRQFSTKGQFYLRFKAHTDISFIRNHFPLDKFRHDVVIKPNGSQKIRIFDKDDNRVALYVRVPGYDHLLTTYEYDSERRLVKILSPLYHEKVDTYSKIDSWKPGDDNLTAEEKQWQRLLGAHFEYDANGELIRKTTPDGGTIEFIYNSGGEQRFVINPSPGNSSDVTYFDYDDRNQIIASGQINDDLSPNALKLYLNRPLPRRTTTEFQQIDYSDQDYEPTLRRHMKRITTFNDKQPIVEELHYDNDNNVIEKNTLAPLGGMDDVMDIVKQYKGGRLRTVIYPMSVNGREFQLVYSYNKLGQLKSLGTADNPSYFAQFTYNANGLISTENMWNFKRTYAYNSPGYLARIQDPYISEDIYYTEQGYGQEGFGDGIVMQAAFNATWTNHADWRQFVLKENAIDDKYSRLCIRALKRTGYITDKGIPIKLFNPSAELTMPVLCSGMTGYRLAKAVAARQPPQHYGHRYSYGNHQELVKAKYYSQGSFADPLTPDSFVKPLKIRPQQSRDLWKSLTDSGFIIKDVRRDDSVYGNRGKSFLRENELRLNLKDHIGYIDPIQKLLINAIGLRKTISQSEFLQTFSLWDEGRIDQDESKQRADQIYKILSDNNYLSNNTISALNSDFKDAVSGFSKNLPDIVESLSRHFYNALGENPFDSASYNIDANGNHRLFYTGFDRYELDYIINRILSVNVRHNGEKEQRSFPMEHDLRGNVISALHKDIERIDYHPVSQKTTAIYMKDGRTICFLYDARGERLSKRVLSPEGDLIHETKYIRDEEGRVLMDIRTDFPSDPLPVQEIATAYIYGPRGLLGFVRDDAFYSVTTDHAGSVRLVVKNGQVVAAYDYLPYGQLMRTYGNDKRSHIMYRFTGQEWDEETGLYNYHARLYDPEIGRFYQLDPQAQYFSPYMYAGNSPVSLVDPDGELALLLTLIITSIGLAISGAYLGGASANNRWNPVEWDLQDQGTWLSIFGGALAGGLAPAAIAASIVSFGAFPAILATSVAGVMSAYISAGATSNQWDPSKWKWDRPLVWSALFEGALGGAGMVSGVGSIKGLAANLGKIQKAILIGTSVAGGMGLMYGNGVVANGNNFAFWEWDFSSPSTWRALVDGFDVGMRWPQSIMEMQKGVAKLFKNIKHLKATTKSFKPAMIKILKNSVKSHRSPLYKVALATLAAYYVGTSANGSFDEWANVFGTYQAIFNGILKGKDGLGFFKSRMKSNIKSKELPSIRVNVKRTFMKPVIARIKVIDKRTRLLSNALKEGQRVRTIPTARIKVTDKRIRYLSDALKEGQKMKAIPNTRIKAIERRQRLLSNISKQRQKLTEISTNFVRVIESRRKLIADVWKVEVVPGLTRLFNSFMTGKVKHDLIRKYGTTLSEADKKLIKISSIDKNCKRSLDAEKVTVGNAVPFLDCGKRRRRALGFGATCNPVKRIQPATNNNKDNINMMTKFATEPNFKDSFNSLLDNTHSVHATIGRNFFLNFICSSVMLMNNHLRLNNRIRETYASSIQRQPDFDMISQQFIFIEESDFDGSTSIHVRTVADTSSDSESFTRKWNDNKITNINSLEKVISGLGIDRDKVQIDASLNIIDRNKNDRGKVQIINDASKNNLKISDLSDDGDVVLNKVENLGQILEKAFEEFITEPEMVAKKSKLIAFFEILMDGYQSSRNLMETDENDLHGYVYGVLNMNLKKRFELDVSVERIGGDYFNIIVLPRKDSSKNKTWLSTPIIIELKSNEESADNKLLDQIKNTGYIYAISMKTTSRDPVFVVEMNMSKGGDVGLETMNLPVYKGLIAELSKASFTRTNIEEALKHLYFSFSNWANNGANVYMSRLILGEILGRGNIQKCYIATTKDGIMLILFKSYDKWRMLNVMENSGRGFPGKVTVPDDVNGSITRLDVKFDVKSSNGWDEATRIDANDRSHYFQELNVSEIKPEHSTDNIFKESFEPIAMEYLINEEINFVNLWLDKINQKIKSFDFLIKSESDFQALLHGMCMGSSTKIPIETGNGLMKTIKVFTEANHSTKGRIDLIVSMLQYNTKTVTEKILVSIETKYSEASTSGLINRELNAALELNKIHSKNIETLSDLDTIINVAVIYDSKSKRLHYETSEEQIRSPEIDELDESSDFEEMELDEPESRRRREAKFDSYDVHNSTQISLNEKLDFWPIKVIKNIASMINNTVGYVYDNTTGSEQYDTPNPLHEGPTLLEMGDEWISTNDVQGNLTWAVILARKLFGGRPIEMSNDSRSRYNIEIEIQSAEIVEEFLDRLKRTAVSCGIVVQVRQIIEQIDLRPLKKTIYDKLNRGQIDEIPQLLYDRILNHTVQKVAARSTKKQADKFSRLIYKDKAKLQSELIKMNAKLYEMKNDRDVKHERWSNSNDRNLRIYQGIKRIDHDFNDRHVIA